MSGKYGIETIKKVLAVLIEAGNVLDKVKATPGPITGKLAFMLELTDELFALTGFSTAAFVQEVKDLDGAEKESLLAFLKEKLDLADDAVEAKVESGLALLVKLEGVIEEIVAFVKPAAPAPEAPAPEPAPAA